MSRCDVGGGAGGGVSLEVSETDGSTNVFASTCPLRCDCCYYYHGYLNLQTKYGNDFDYGKRYTYYY